MHLITTSPDHVVTTPNAVMTGLAAPSRGSSELSTWRVAMAAGARGPEHSVDREQVWTVTAGTVEVTSAGRTERIAAGQTLVLPPHAPRRVHAVEAAEAHVAMCSDALVTVPGEAEPRVLPWAR
ncbi:cupin domain-containing protein [Streptomyces roseus]|uniref:cupin domain-containing protein n=1 Tax=Streptomyces roseus TaxID=66430 RepID=UPI0036C0029A